MKDVKELKECLACGGNDLVPTIDLGEQPLANSFKKEINEPEEKYPLRVNYCETCHHLQLTHIVNPSIIYKDYLYVSGTSDEYKKYMDWYARFTIEYQWEFNKKPVNPRILDIGCNDGSQLDAYKNVENDYYRIKVSTYGVDPATLIVKTAGLKGHDVYDGFWDVKMAQRLKDRLRNERFDIISSQNAFSHIENPLEYLKLVRGFMYHGSLLFISVSQVDMVRNGEFDTIYHEHISFFNTMSMETLAKRAGLRLIDVVKTPIHGNTNIYILAKNDEDEPEKDVHYYKIQCIKSMEEKIGLYKESTYKKWSNDITLLKYNVNHDLNLVENGEFLFIGYGAAAKANTFLNYCNLRLHYIVDDNPLKQGKFSPGMSIPVVSSDFLETLSLKQKVVFFPLAWNLFDEIVSKIKEKRNNSNDFFVRGLPNSIKIIQL